MTAGKCVAVLSGLLAAFASVGDDASLVQLMPSVAVDDHQDAVAKMRAAIDSNNDGLIDLQEMVTFGLSNGLNAVSVQKEFPTFDVDGSGVLEAHEVGHLIDVMTKADSAPQSGTKTSLAELTETAASKAAEKEAAAAAQAAMVVSTAEVNAQTEKQVDEDISVGPKSVFETMNVGVGSLGQRLTQMKAYNEKTIATQMAVYTQKLKAQQVENSQLENEVMKLKVDIAKLDAGNKALRSRAVEVKQDNGKFRDAMKALQQNLTSAQLYTAGSLESLDDKGAPSLEVLSELDAKDRDKDSVLDGEKKMTAIGTFREEGISMVSFPLKGGGSSMLEMEAETTPDVAPGILKTLHKNLEDLATAEEQSEKHLGQVFLQDFKAGALLHASLEHDRESLQGQEASLIQLRDRLKTAVSHLEATNGKLAASYNALRRYCEQMRGPAGGE